MERLPEGHPIIGDIVFDYWPKPIPTRAYDWCAHLDGYEEAGPYGWGPTRDQARADLLEQLLNGE
jgi:hypothetical protein